jgi:uncharacterized lipoprotein YehR (DUF1307 family)
MKKIAVLLLALFAMSMTVGCMECPDREKNPKKKLESFGCDK